MAALDLSVSFPRRGVIRLRSRRLFGDVEGADCRRFLERVFESDAITGVTIRGGPAARAELRFRPAADRLDRVVHRVVTSLREEVGDATSGRRPAIGALAAARDHRGVVRYICQDGFASGWRIAHERPGRLELKNRALARAPGLGRAIERAMVGILGVERCRCRTGPRTGTVRVDFDPAQLDRDGVIAAIDAAHAGAGRRWRIGDDDRRLPVCTAALPIAAAAQFAVPALLPVAAGVFAYTSFPAFRAAYRTLVRERRLGVDALDAIVALGCLGTMAIFPGAVLCWCRSFGQTVVERALDRSHDLLLGPFGRRPQQAWLDRDGTEVRVDVDRLKQGDLVVVSAGEVVPVDGRVVAGMALIDRRAPTGEPMPAEVGAGDWVFAATFLVAGRVSVSVEAAAAATAAARIGRLLDEAAGDTLPSQRRVEGMADRAVLPMLGLGAVGLVALGPGAAAAVLKCEVGTGLRMAAPLAMLGAVARCAHRGILLRDGGALERMGRVDAVVFDEAAIADEDPTAVHATVAALRRRGIEHITPAGDAAHVAALRREGHTVCYVGGGGDPAVLGQAGVSVSLGGAAAIDADAAHVVLWGGDLGGLCELRDVARELERDLGRGRSIVLAANAACIAGVFTMGFGILAAVAINNLAALAALGGGVRPLGRLAQLEAERRHRLELYRSVAAGGSSSRSRPDPAALATPAAAAYHGS